MNAHSVNCDRKTGQPVGAPVARKPPFLKPNDEHQAIAYRNYDQKREHAARDTPSDEVLNSQVSLACL